MPEIPPEIERRLQRIETKLDDRVVYRDTYEAQRQAIEDKIAAMASAGARETKAAADLITEKVDNVESRVDGLEKWRITVYALMGTFLVTLVGGIILFILETSRTQP